MSHIIFEKAKELLNQGEWIKRDYAKDKNSNNVGKYSPEATSFCLVGALDKACFDLKLPISKLIDSIYKLQYLSNINLTLTAYNDYPSTTKEDILNLLDKGIKYEKMVNASKKTY